MRAPAQCYVSYRSDSGESQVKKLIAVLTIVSILTLSAAAKGSKENSRVQNAGEVMTEILNVPDDIPQSLVDKAECVIVLPSVLKLAIGIGGNYGRGVMTCRTNNFKGPWGAPTMMALEGGSFGLQLGGQATDFVLLVMNERGANGILTGKVKLGADASASAGPKGRDLAAATDVTLRSEILSYSRSRGLFAGISLEGSTLRPDNGANKSLYGKEIPATDIVLKKAVAPPPSAKLLLGTLNKKSPKHE
jgi:lipid-binding SYLF domain-containing protein